MTWPCLVGRRACLSFDYFRDEIGCWVDGERIREDLGLGLDWVWVWFGILE